MTGVKSVALGKFTLKSNVLKVYSAICGKLVREHSVFFYNDNNERAKNENGYPFRH